MALDLRLMLAAFKPRSAQAARKMRTVFGLAGRPGRSLAAYYASNSRHSAAYRQEHCSFLHCAAPKLTFGSTPPRTLTWRQQDYPKNDRF
jgi:hypothetical protein